MQKLKALIKNSVKKVQASIHDKYSQWYKEKWTKRVEKKMEAALNNE